MNRIIFIIILYIYYIIILIIYSYTKKIEEGIQEFII
jgi:hypothetical protein